MSGASFEISYTTTGIFNAGNVFSAELSDDEGNFDDATVVGNTTALSSGTILVSIPVSLATKKNYFLRVVSSTPEVIGSVSAETFEILCPKPDSLYSSNITAVSAKVHWATESCALNYVMKYRMQSGSWTKVNANNNTKLLKELLPATTYEWKVKSKCVNDPKVYSKFSPVKNFTTLPMKEGTPASVKSSALAITIYPNPVVENSVIYASCDIADGTPVLFTVFDAAGKLLKTLHSDMPSGHEIPIPIGNWPGGMYFLQMQTATQCAVAWFNIR